MIKCLTFKAEIGEGEIHVVCDSNFKESFIKEGSTIQTMTMDLTNEICKMLKADFERFMEEKIKMKRIVIDPGHGGTDPGAISPTGTCLHIARKITEKPCNQCINNNLWEDRSE